MPPEVHLMIWPHFADEETEAQTLIPKSLLFFNSHPRTLPLLERERKEGRKHAREMAICEKIINWLTLICM